MPQAVPVPIAQAPTIAANHLLAHTSVAEEDCKLPAGQRALLAALAGCAEGSADLPMAEAKGHTVAALVQATTARLRWAGKLRMRQEQGVCCIGGIMRQA